MPSHSNISIRQTWKRVWDSSTHRLLVITGSLLLFTLLIILPSFFNLIEQRDGITLNDWLLSNIPSYNVSNYIFMIIWGMALLGIIRAIYKPIIYTRFVWVYSVICIIRIITISVIPLNPPTGIMELKDPLTGIFYGHVNITKDLFFSGHTATLCLMFLLLDKKRDKIIALTATIIAAALLLIQHVHYTIDVIAAPFIVYGVYKLCDRWLFSKI